MILSITAFISLLYPLKVIAIREKTQNIKNSVLALITVMGSESIAKLLNISIEKVEEIISEK